MSFQDVGKRNSNRNAATAGFSGANPRSNNSNSQQGSLFGGMTTSFGGSGSVSQISESLTQYQVCFFFFFGASLSLSLSLEFLDRVSFY